MQRSLPTPPSRPATPRACGQRRPGIRHVPTKLPTASFTRASGPPPGLPGPRDCHRGLVGLRIHIQSGVGLGNRACPSHPCQVGKTEGLRAKAEQTLSKRAYRPTTFKNGRAGATGKLLPHLSVTVIQDLIARNDCS